MKKLLFVLIVAILAACGESVTAPVATSDTTFKQESLTEIPTIEVKKVIDTTKKTNKRNKLKEIKEIN